MPVRVTVRGERREGHVLGWRGDRVYVQTTTGTGMDYLGWVPAKDVERQWTRAATCRRGDRP